MIPHELIRSHRYWRMLETIPGALAIIALILPAILSAFTPRLAASFMIVYTVVWLFRSLKLSINLYRSSRYVQHALKEDWERLINLNDHPEKIDYEIKKLQTTIEKNTKNSDILKKTRAKLEEMEKIQTQIAHLKKTGQYKKSREIIQAILYVTYKESYELIRESIKSYTQAKFPADRIILVFAGEESDEKNFLAITEKIRNEFGTKFLDMIVSIHPKNIPGEIKGKSANATHAAKELRKYLDQNDLAYDNVLTSVFDADTVVHPFYFSELTFKYLTTDRRTEKGYQPTHMFHNNIWDVPIPVRMVALSCTFWRMAESMDKEKYKSFSSRSLSFQTAVDVDYWDPSVIPEDSRQFWTAYNIYDGRHELIAIYSPVYMDAVLSETYFKTFQNQYSQLRRWAWGVCDFPFVVLNLLKHPKISPNTKIRLIFEFLNNSVFWSTGPILISFMGFLPSLLNPAFRETVLAYNLPKIMSDILTLASAGIVMCTFIGLILIPRHPKNGLWGKISLTLQWLLIPVVSIFLSAVPALDAQLRLMLGKRLEYKVTEKARK